MENIWTVTVSQIEIVGLYPTVSGVNNVSGLISQCNGNRQLT